MNLWEIHGDAIDEYSYCPTAGQPDTQVGLCHPCTASRGQEKVSAFGESATDSSQTGIGPIPLKKSREGSSIGILNNNTTLSAFLQFQYFAGCAENGQLLNGKMRNRLFQRNRPQTSHCNLVSALGSSLGEYGKQKLMLPQTRQNWALQLLGNFRPEPH